MGVQLSLHMKTGVSYLHTQASPIWSGVHAGCGKKAFDLSVNTSLCEASHDSLALLRRRSRSRARRFRLAAAFLPATLSCGGGWDSPTTPTRVSVATVVISGSTEPLVVGSTRQLTAVARDQAGTALDGRVVSWSSSDTLKARVSASGLLTAIAPGTLVVSATSEGRT